MRHQWLLVAGVLFACGGRSHEDVAPGGTAGASVQSGGAGSGSGGTSAGGGGTAGAGASGGSGVACCHSIPVCDPGEEQVASLDACPDGAACREVTRCCSTIVCATTPECLSVPVCDQGDTVVTACAPGDFCYTRTDCGGSITCRDDFCDPSSEPDRKYIGLGDCMLIDFTCPEHTTMFANDCGCGCEQDPKCPDAIDCSPGPDPNPNCTEEQLALCPYSIRGL